MSCAFLFFLSWPRKLGLFFFYGISRTNLLTRMPAFRFFPSYRRKWSITLREEMRGYITEKFVLISFNKYIILTLTCAFYLGFMVEAAKSSLLSVSSMHKHLRFFFFFFTCPRQLVFIAARHFLLVSVSQIFWTILPLWNWEYGRNYNVSY